MSIKIKISIIAICFALVAAVCIGFVFAAPNETITMNGNVSYEVPKQIVTASPNNTSLGSVTGGGSFDFGETVILTATKKSGSTFRAWATSTDPNEMKILSTSRTYSFELTEDSPTTYFALFNRTTPTRQTVGGLKYTFYSDAKLASVKDTTSTSLSGALEIPSVVESEGNSYKVYSIERSAFHSCSSLTSIKIPEGVTSIGSSAFWGCRSLTTIKIPEGVTSIGQEAFRECSSLTSVSLPSTLTSIGDYAFSGCSSLTSITLPSTLTSIGDYAFEGCSSLEAFNGDGNEYYTIDDNRALLVDGGKTLLAYAPANTEPSYTIPKGVTSIREYVFQNCSSLTSISILEGVTSIGGHAFDGCSKLTSISIPKGVTEIGISAFSGCSSLTSIQIPEGVTEIGSYTFDGCSNLTSVSLPSTLTSIGLEAFSSCSSLTTITIPEGVTSIGSSAFSSCSSLTTITIPEGVTSIRARTFQNCSSLTSITINGNITSLGTSVFYRCSKLTSLTLGAEVTSLPSNLFTTSSDLTNLTEIVVEDGSNLSAALPTYGTWVKDGGSGTVTNFSGVGTYTKQP